MSMTADELLAKIESIADDKNREFFSRLSHTRYKLYGVRVPDLRKLAKQLIKEGEADDALALPPQCYEHVMLKGILTATAKIPLAQKTEMLDAYAALIDDWALCDVVCACLKLKSREEFDAMREFAASAEPFKARLGLVAIESCFCNEQYAREIDGVVRSICAQGYYVDTGAAWLVCTLECKVKGAGLDILLSGALSDAASAMCAGKMRDSRRVDRETVRLAAEYVKARKGNKTR